MPILSTPLNELCQTGQLVSSKRGSEVYRVQYEGIKAELLIKHLSIPASQGMVDGLIASGAVENQEAALAYYNQEMESLKEQLALLDSMREHPHMLPYLDTQIVQKTEGVGFDVYLLTLHAKTVRELMQEHAFSPRTAIELGLHIADALRALREKGLLCQDIRPENLFRDPDGQFRLGDLGVLPIEGMEFATLPDRYVSAYTAPELCDVMGIHNLTVDVYSLAMILWVIFNGYQPPFDGNEARRRAGEVIPAAAHADTALNSVLLRALSPHPEVRYPTPDEFIAALEPLLADAGDELIVAPAPEPELESQPDSEPATAQPDAPRPKVVQPRTEAPKQTKPVPAPPFEKDSPNEVTVTAATSERLERSFEKFQTLADDDDDVLDALTGRRKKPRRIWPKVLAAVIVLALAVGAYTVWTYYQRYSVYDISNLTLSIQGTDTMLVNIVAPAEAQLNVTLADAEGQQMHTQPYTGQILTFTGLEAGQSYQVSLSTADTHPLSGATRATVSTPQPTEILSFTATARSASEIALEFTSTGYEPEHWTLTHADSRGNQQTSSFTGHSLLINGLASGETYTFTITDGNNQPVLGTSTVTCETDRVTNLSALEIDDSVYGQLTVNWTSTGNIAEQWTVTCSGSDGSYRSEVVDTQSDRLSYTFEDLPAGLSYEIHLSCDGLTNEDDATRSIELPLCTITNFIAYPASSDTINVSWSFIDGDEPESWKLNVTLVDTGETSVHAVIGNTFELDNLLPNTEYRFELTAGNGLIVGGCEPVTATTDAAGKFDDYSTSGIFLGFFALPNKENWALQDLTQSVPGFSHKGGMAFAVEVSYKPTNSEKQVDTLYIIRDSNDRIVSYSLGSLSWPGSSTKETHYGGFDQAPSTPGDYTLEIYFNGELLTKKGFSVV